MFLAIVHTFLLLKFVGYTQRKCRNHYTLYNKIQAKLHFQSQKPNEKKRRRQHENYQNKMVFLHILTQKRHRFSFSKYRTGGMA